MASTDVKLAKTGRGHGIKTQKFYHSCGGQIFVKLLFKNRKLTPMAECEKCHVSARKPSLIMVKQEKKDE
jgi:hypothetical protein